MEINVSKLLVANIVDMYAYDWEGGILSPKFVKIYFKLAIDESSSALRLVDVDFLVPTIDFQSRRLGKGKNILVEEFPDKSLKYLGVEGDWETLHQMGVSPRDFVKFRNFSTSPRVIFEETPSSININYMSGEVRADRLGNKLCNIKSTDDTGRKLLSKFASVRGLEEGFNPSL